MAGPAALLRAAAAVRRAVAGGLTLRQAPAGADGLVRRARGIGSLYYLFYAIDHGLGDGLSSRLLSLVLWVVAASIAVHGISVTPLMKRYEGRAQRRREATA